ncbi:hypothetical protein PB1E_0171 [Leuconostoc gelidum subsp. gasicomitatum]|nr:hypothetical protein PB1E_0171 [Leuconostoc gasicomitatum]
MFLGEFTHNKINVSKLTIIKKATNFLVTFDLLILYRS